ncbi:MAG TPA: class I SAM-dependent methyltransferase [Solirubrobacteraceae bacterium]|jgi:ubiquinone/menaquinone biosynthesis C-methylase UbiE|nr:class I SAM-dependent methyltransferase [Solirubrobacteraceae bacterium]
MSGARSEAFVTASVPEAYDRLLVGPVFEPWARELVRRVAPAPGATVLDLACGPGTVARLVAERIGTAGRVVACDISPAMLAVASAVPGVPGAAPIEYVESSADALPVADAACDVVVCQQGLQFFPDRPAALNEMRRALRDGGTVALAVWAVERPLGLFGPIGETVRDCGVPEPYPRAFEPDSYALGAPALRDLLAGGGWRDVTVELVELECVWATRDAVLGTVFGTPFGPLIAGLTPVEHERFTGMLAERLGAAGDGEVRVRTAAHIASATR